MTTDLTDYIGDVAASKLASLCTIKTFAKRYMLSERGVMRHAIVGDIPIVFIDEVPFIIDLGADMLGKIGRFEVHRSDVMFLHKMLTERLKDVNSLKSFRAKKSGHRRSELRRDLVKDKSMLDTDYFKIGMKNEE
jgi:hypothetical protein